MTHDDGVYLISFSPDGKYVVSGGIDGSARIWNARTGVEVARMVHVGVVTSLAFSPNLEYVASSSGDGAVRIWHWQPEYLIADACSHATRNLTRSEWEQYIGDALPYEAVCPNLPIEN
jgi:WD40 repeat protein